MQEGGGNEQSDRTQAELGRLLTDAGATGYSRATARTSAGWITSATSGTLTTLTRSSSAVAVSSRGGGVSSLFVRWRRLGDGRGQLCCAAPGPVPRRSRVLELEILDWCGAYCVRYDLLEASTEGMSTAELGLRRNRALSRHLERLDAPILGAAQCPLAADRLHSGRWGANRQSDAHLVDHALEARSVILSAFCSNRHLSANSSFAEYKGQPI